MLYYMMLYTLYYIILCLARPCSGDFVAYALQRQV